MEYLIVDLFWLCILIAGLCLMFGVLGVIGDWLDKRGY